MSPESRMTGLLRPVLGWAGGAGTREPASLGSTGLPCPLPAPAMGPPS